MKIKILLLVGMFLTLFSCSNLKKEENEKKFKSNLYKINKAIYVINKRDLRDGTKINQIGLFACEDIILGTEWNVIRIDSVDKQILIYLKAHRPNSDSLEHCRTSYFLYESFDYRVAIFEKDSLLMIDDIVVNNTYLPDLDYKSYINENKKKYHHKKNEYLE